MADESLSSEIEPKHSRHVEWGASLNVLDVGVCPCLNEQLHAEGTVGEVGGIVQWGLASVVESIEGDLVLQEDVHHNILTIVAGNMKRSAPVGVDCIRLGKV